MFNRLSRPEMIAKGLPRINRQKPAPVRLQPVVKTGEQLSPAVETQQPAHARTSCNLGFFVLRFTV